MPDPRLNCAAEICCPPPAAREAKESIVAELIANVEVTLKVDGKDAGSVDLQQHIVKMMKDLDIEFAPGELMRAIRNLADHPNRKAQGREHDKGHVKEKEE